MHKIKYKFQEKLRMYVSDPKNPLILDLFILVWIQHLNYFYLLDFVLLYGVT